MRYWTGHSSRHTLPSLAAALEVGKEKRDFLGRWAYSQHGSQDYVLTARQVVHGVQNHVCRTLLEGSAAGGYVEEETLHDFESFARAHGVLEDVVSGHRVLKWDKSLRSWRLGGDFPACLGVVGNEAEASGDLAEAKEPFVVLEPDKVEEAVKRASREGRPLKDTLTEVMKDFQLKEQYLTAPIALSSGSRDSSAWKRQPFWGQEDSNKWQRNEGKGAAFKGKGKKGKKVEKGAKGGGKTDGKSGKGTTGRTADGRLIYYAYNNEGCDGNCGMVHCCQVRGCYGAHPTWKHWQE